MVDGGRRRAPGRRHAHRGPSRERDRAGPGVLRRPRAPVARVQPAAPDHGAHVRRHARRRALRGEGSGELSTSRPGRRTARTCAPGRASSSRSPRQSRTTSTRLCPWADAAHVDRPGRRPPPRPGDARRHRPRLLAAASGAVVAGVLPMFLTAGLALRIDADVAFGEVSLGFAVAAFHVLTVSAVDGARRRAAGRAHRSGAGPAALGRAGHRRDRRDRGSGPLGHRADRAAGRLLVLPTAPPVRARARSWPQAVPVRRRGLAFGAQQAGAPLAALLAGLGLAGVAAALGWRRAFVLAALVGAAAVAVVPPAAARLGAVRRHAQRDRAARTETGSCASWPSPQRSQAPRAPA